MEVRTKTKTYRFETDIIDHAEQNPMIQSFAKWACERYRQEFMSISGLKNKKDYFSRMLQECTKQIEEYDHAELGIDSLFCREELTWIQTQGIERVKRFTFEGVYNKFCNDFCRDDITRRQFRIVIYRYNNKNTQKQNKNSQKLNKNDQKKKIL